MVPIYLHYLTTSPSFPSTALIAVIGGDEINDMGYLYVVYPVGLGMLIMLTVALALNNLVGTRSYPTGEIGRLE